MTDHSPFAPLPTRRWREAILDVVVPAAAALLTAALFVLVVR